MQSLRIPDLFSSRLSCSIASITWLSSSLVRRARGTRSCLDRKSLSCLCISQRDTLSDSLYTAYTNKVYGFRQLSIYLLLFEGSMPTTTRIHYGTLEFSVGRTIITSLYTRRLTTVKVYIHTSAHTHVILLRTSGCTSGHTRFIYRRPRSTTNASTQQ